MTAHTPFFIIGAGRSGTTLMRLILSGHSRLHVPAETHFIGDLVNFPLDKPLSRDQVTAVVGRIVTHRRWPLMKMSADVFRDQAMNLRSPRMADVLNLIYRHHLRCASKARWGDKTPDYVRHVPSLLKIYPDARFILMIRDGHDVAMSFSRQGWGQAYHGPRHEWVRAVRAGLSYREAPFADRILEVRYEQMVRDLAGTVSLVCDFIGETFEPGMLDWHARIDMPAEWRGLHRKLYEPINPNEAQAWRRTLGGAECFLIEASLFHELKAIGYELRFSGPVWRPLLIGAGALVHVAAPLLDKVLPALVRRKFLARPLYI